MYELYSPRRVGQEGCGKISIYMYNMSPSHSIIFHGDMVQG